MKNIILLLVAFSFFSCQTDVRDSSGAHNNEKKVDSTYIAILAEPQEDTIAIVNKIQSELASEIQADVGESKSMSYLDSLKSAYNLDHTEFIRLFPDSFRKFRAVFDYMEHGDNLSSNSFNYIQLFFVKSSGAEVSKIVQIAKDGSWDADAINHFQVELCKHILKYSSEYIVAFDSLEKIQLNKFFRFLLDGPSPKDKEKLELKEKLGSLLGGKYGLMLNQQYEKIIQDWE